MKVLVVNRHFHPKNEQGLYLMLRHLKWDIRMQPTATKEDIEWADIIYSPFTPLQEQAVKFPNKLFFFGPHFGVFPDVLPHIESLETPSKNTYYLQPSSWVVDLFRSKCKKVEILQHPFAVDTERFQPQGNQKQQNTVLLYSKNRNPAQIEYARNFLKQKGYTVLELNYKTKYTEENFKEIVQKVKGCLWVGCHESQGFAFQEALSMNLPLCVWNVKSLADEWNGGRPDIPATSCSYWDASCGEVFTEKENLEKTWMKYWSYVQEGMYMPRDFIVKKVGVAACGERLQKLVEVLFGLLEVRRGF